MEGIKLLEKKLETRIMDTIVYKTLCWRSEVMMMAIGKISTFLALTVTPKGYKRRGNNTLTCFPVYKGILKIITQVLLTGPGDQTRDPYSADEAGRLLVCMNYYRYYLPK